MNKLEQNIRKNEKISKEFGLIVRVDKKDFMVEDIGVNGQPVKYASSQIFLVPIINSASSQFFDAWLPQYTFKQDGKTPYHHEVIVQFGYPINRYVRCGVCRKNNIYPDAHHITLMSSEACEDILSKMIGRNLQILVMPDNSAEDKV